MADGDAPSGDSGETESNSADGSSGEVETAKSGDDWLELELRDADDNPAAGQEYVVTFSDGREVKGTLDEQGCARIDGVPEGDAEVEFPGIDDDDLTDA